MPVPIAPSASPYYGGGQVANPIDVSRLPAGGAPSASDISLKLGATKIDSTTKKAYMLVSKALGVASWLPLGSLIVVPVAGTSQAILPGNNYILNAAGATSLSLPATAKVGDRFAIASTPTNAGGWVITQATGQTIRQGASASTTGATGTVTGVANTAIQVVCVVANVSFVVDGSGVGLTFA